MSKVDVLIATALEMERDAVRNAARWTAERGAGVRHWETKDTDRQPEYLLGEYGLPQGGHITIALARPTRMGGNFTSNVVSTLMERLDPRCLAMCGVCAGNPSDLALGDVVIANTVFQYDEGKRTDDGFEGDLFQTPMENLWVQRAKDLRPDGLPSHGIASEADATLWLLERLYYGVDPVRHPARDRYFPKGSWGERVIELERLNLLKRVKQALVITPSGKAFVDSRLAYAVDPPSKLPFAIKVGPIASGNAVVKDGIAWDMLKHAGQRSAVALEMEAAGIGAASYTRGLSKWIVIKGVMDYADREKNDRYKTFAARASAEVLLRFIENSADDILNRDRKVQYTNPPSGLTSNTNQDLSSADLAGLGQSAATDRKSLQQNVADLLITNGCASLLVSGAVKWREFIEDLVNHLQLKTSVVDLRSTKTRARNGFVKAILEDFGIVRNVPSPPSDLEELVRHIELLNHPLLVVTHFDFFLQWGPKRRVDILSTFANIVDFRTAAILVVSRIPFYTIVPDQPDVESWFRPEEIVLR